MKIKAKDIIAQVDMKYLQEISSKLDVLVRDFSNPIFVQLKPQLDKLVTDYKQFVAKQQTSQQSIQ